MVSLSVDGLVSGLDTTSLVSQLVAAEALPQTRLKAQMSAAQKAADAYRAVNTKVDAVRTAAEALTADGLAAARTATSSDTSVSASATSTAVAGTRLTFTVLDLASTSSVLSTGEWTSPSASARSGEPGWPLEIMRGGVSVGTVDVPAGATLADAVAAINDRDLGVRATTIRVGEGKYRLQLISETPGAGGAVTVKRSTDTTTTVGSGFPELSPARDAKLRLENGMTVSSSSNTFADVMTGLSVIVTKADTTKQVSIEVAEDPKALAAKVRSLVDAVNAALTSISTNTNGGTGSTAVLKGDSTLRQLASRLLTKVSDAVPGAVPSASTPGTYTAGSPAALGVQLTRDGKVAFDEATFLKSLQSDPEAIHRLLGGAPASDGAPAVEGLAQRLATTAKDATKSTTGTLTLLAQGREALVKDFQSRIADWDLRLAVRREALTRQFSAMETALSSLKNQSSWLAGQLGSLSG